MKKSFDLCDFGGMRGNEVYTTLIREAFNKINVTFVTLRLPPPPFPNVTVGSNRSSRSGNHCLPFGGKLF